MPFADPVTMTYGDGTDAASSTETGTVALTATTPPGCTITRVLGGGGNSSIVPSNAGALRARLDVDLPAIAAAPGHGFAEDIVDTAADDDPERVEYLENSAVVKITKSVTQNVTMKPDTAEGLRLALVALGV